ncbi:hypothetical protein C0J52_17905 [Blattella germanica]|nr:hypothetical protein C0J52_17905 [Blattella germanica]
MSRKSTKGAKTPSESLKKEDILSAVVIVDNFKDGFQPITDSIPPALIPIVNIPLLDYTLKFLSLSSVQETILFCCSHADLIKQHIKQKKWDDESSKMNITMFVSETCRSIGDVMRDLDAKAVLRSDFILVSGNMVGNLNILPIVQKHREVQKKDRNAVLTMVYKAAGPGHTSRSLDDEAILAVDASSGKVLAHHRLKSGSKKSHDVIYRWVYPFVPDASISWEEEPYMFLRRNVYKQKSVTLGKGSILEEDVVVAEKSNIGENTHISHSVIGKNCHIGNNVSIYKSYIWDNVTIGDNCSISYSVIGHRSVIGKNVKLNKGCTMKYCKGCIIGPGVVLPDNCALQGSTIIASSEQRKDDGDLDEEYKLEKLAEKAYSLQVIKSESDSEERDENQQLQGFWLHTPKEEDESDSENEFSDSEKSDRASPIPDDTHLFFTEVIDSLTRGFDDKLHPDNLILEINSSRYAYNDMATSTDILRECLIKLLHLLYEKDILTEDNIMEWHKSSDEESETAASLRKQVAPFIQWLEEADEESDDSGSD